MTEKRFSIKSDRMKEQRMKGVKKKKRNNKIKAKNNTKLFNHIVILFLK